MFATAKRIWTSAVTMGAEIEIANAQAGSRRAANAASQPPWLNPQYQMRLASTPGTLSSMCLAAIPSSASNVNEPFADGPLEAPLSRRSYTNTPIPKRGSISVRWRYSDADRSASLAP